MNLSFNRTFLTFFLYVRQNWINSGNFSVRGYLPLVQKDSTTHMHCLTVYVKEGLRFGQDLSLENSADSYLCFWLALLDSVSSFSSIDHLLRLYAWFLILFHDSVWMRFFRSTHFHKVFVFNVHHKDWLNYSGGTDRPAELCYNFSNSGNLTQMVNFPTWIPDCHSHSPALLDLFLSPDASICFTMASIGKFWSCCLSFQWLSIKFTTACPTSSHTL